MAKKEPYEIHVISNTHWDREWVYPYEETRLLLVEFMDHLLDLLDKQRDYHSFLMDSQVGCVDDYVELRPENRARIEKHVKSGRLIIGPWYTLPEEYIVNGESLVRNLVVGHRAAKSYGKVSKIGYTPFSYGQTSQMPQIYNGFGIDTIIFYRGINTPHSEFIMEGPDGSRLLGMRFGALSRFSYYFYIYRVVMHNKTRDEWWYDWERGALPFRLCSEEHPLGHYYIVDPAKKYLLLDKIPEGLRKLVRDESQHFTTRYIACMQGFDSSEPDPLERMLIDECQKHLKDGVIFQSSLEAYMKKMRKAVKDPTVIRGESRDPGATGKWTHLFGDVLSSRTRTKRRNARTEQALQRWAEPFATVAWTLGAEYPKAALDRTWKMLLQNHPHDTICGAGIDQMEKDMVHRYDQCDIISEGVMRRAFQAIQYRIDNSDIDQRDAVLTVFNPCPYERSEVVTAYVDLPDTSEYETFSIRDPKRKEMPKQEVSRYPQGTLVRNLTDISLELRAQRVKLHFWADRIPALGYKTFHIKHEKLDSPVLGSLVVATNTMENEHLRVHINDNGTLRVEQKPTGKVYDGLHYLEDCGETGHSWVHMTPEFDEVITSHGVPVDIALEEAGPLLARYRVDYRMMIPVGLEQKPDGVHRSVERKEVVVTSYITLRKGQRWVDIRTQLDNPCKHHRLRAVFPTHIDADVSCAEAAFDVIERKVERGPDSPYYGRENPTYPNHRFVDVSDGEHGIAIINDGIREYEVKDVPERPIALTLLRGYEFKQSPVIDRWDVHPEMLLSQSLGEHEWRYAIYPHTGRWDDANVYREAELHNLLLKVGEAGRHGGKLPKQLSFFEIKPANLVLSALKKCEERNSLILRLFNPTDRPVRGKITCYKPIKTARLTNLNEERQKTLNPQGNSLNLTVGKKKIVTVELRF